LEVCFPNFSFPLFPAPGTPPKVHKARINIGLARPVRLGRPKNPAAGEKHHPSDCVASCRRLSALVNAVVKPENKAVKPGQTWSNQKIFQSIFYLPTPISHSNRPRLSAPQKTLGASCLLRPILGNTVFSLKDLEEVTVKGDKT
jgi:hypothetical protein